jgi:hypothetical protein
VLVSHFFPLLLYVLKRLGMSVPNTQPLRHENVTLLVANGCKTREKQKDFGLSRFVPTC